MMLSLHTSITHHSIKVVRLIVMRFRGFLVVRDHLWLTGQRISRYLWHYHFLHSHLDNIRGDYQLCCIWLIYWLSRQVTSDWRSMENKNQQIQCILHHIEWIEGKIMLLRQLVTQLAGCWQWCRSWPRYCSSWHYACCSCCSCSTHGSCTGSKATTTGMMQSCQETKTKTIDKTPDSSRC